MKMNFKVRKISNNYINNIKFIIVFLFVALDIKVYFIYHIYGMFVKLLLCTKSNNTCNLPLIHISVMYFFKCSA